jgi:uncharacterized protein (TIGR03437 family)
MLAAWLPAMAAPYAAAQQTVSFSPDITVVLGGQTLDDEDAANDDLAGVITPIDVGALPGAADLQAYHRGGPGVGELLVLDTTVALPGGVTATPQKVIAYSGGTYSEALDLSACGLPAGVKIDAMTSGDTMWFSFDTPVSLGGVLHDDEDVVALGAGCAWAPVLDGSAAGIPVGLDLDGLHYQKGTGLLMMSFDGAGTVGGVSFDDEDVVAYDIASASWSMIYDGSSLHPGWLPADLDALDQNTRPIANAGPDRKTSSPGPRGTQVTLNGSGSSDPDGDPLTYLWTGPFGTATGVSPTVTIPGGVHEVKLTVSDGKGGMAMDTVTITVRTLRIRPAHMTFTLPEGGGPESKPFTIEALGGTVSYSIAQTIDWLVSDPQSGQSSGEKDPFDAIVTPGSLRPGNYTGRLVVNGPGAVRQVLLVTLTVTDAGPRMPAPFENGAVDAADFIPFGQPGHPMAPKSLVSVFGTGFVPEGSFAAMSIPLPTMLGGVMVTFDGIKAPLLLVTPTLIICQLPMGVTLPTATMVIDDGAAGKAVSEPQEVQVAEHSPGIFTLTQDGEGPGIVVHAGTADLAAPVGTTETSRPAGEGDNLTIYANGLGPLDPGDPVLEDGHNSCEPDGVCLPDGSNVVLRNTASKPIIRVGGVEVPEENVLFSGASPASVGVGEIVFTMPGGLPTGDAVSLTVEIGGIVSKEATMAVE